LIEKRASVWLNNAPRWAAVSPSCCAEATALLHPPRHVAGARRSAERQQLKDLVLGHIEQRFIVTCVDLEAVREQTDVLTE
jgi:hypothetical protein